MKKFSLKRTPKLGAHSCTAQNGGNPPPGGLNVFQGLLGRSGTIALLNFLFKFCVLEDSNAAQAIEQCILTPSPEFAYTAPILCNGSIATDLSIVRTEYQMLGLYVFTGVPLILFHRLLVSNSEMWIERHQPRLFIKCFCPLLNIKLRVAYRLITRTRVVLLPGASPDDQTKKHFLMLGKT